MNGTPRAQGCAGAVPFRFAPCLTQEAHDCRDAGGSAKQEHLPRSSASQICTVFLICMGAEVARYLSSGLATSTSLWARARHPCRSRSERKVPHTLCYVRNQSALVSRRGNLIQFYPPQVTIPPQTGVQPCKQYFSRPAEETDWLNLTPMVGPNACWNSVAGVCWRVNWISFSSMASGKEERRHPRFISFVHQHGSVHVFETVLLQFKIT